MVFRAGMGSSVEEHALSVWEALGSVLSTPKPKLFQITCVLGPVCLCPGDKVRSQYTSGLFIGWGQHRHWISSCRQKKLPPKFKFCGGFSQAGGARVCFLV